ncbi:hypothetical protein L227DRAFT_577808 [Lentinus tigrinus ALCF2SS1-6]|uniref:Uncharacterized protein n=1 Tax=Lentinus tigrinus ALCF2SS1-6 TaxID=1328759 RepID=A0A5C2S225_9APHY|nr:hypothetical protein L227DRAFT_577808 [Lentinus tigrinus ALCF2SS1-6]
MARGSAVGTTYTRQEGGVRGYLASAHAPQIGVCRFGVIPLNSIPWAVVATHCAAVYGSRLGR